MLGQAAQRQQVMMRCAADYRYWCDHFVRVFDQHKKRVVPYRPWSEQAELDLLWPEHDNILGLKARRIGFSWWVQTRMFWQWYFARGPEQFLVAAQLDGTVMDIIKRDANSFYEMLLRLPKGLQRTLSVRNAHKLQFADTKATIFGFSEKSEGARGKGCSMAWLTEYAFYSRQGKFYSSVEAAISEAGKCVIETTVNKPGDDYHREVVKATQGDSEFHLAFFPWHQHARYRARRMDKDFEMSVDEREFAERYGLDERQVLWYRRKRKKHGERTPAEYPSDVADAFRIVKGVYFKPHLLDPVEAVLMAGEELVLEEAAVGDVYGHGLDIGGGVGADDSTHYVVSATTKQVVYVRATNQVSPGQFAVEQLEVMLRYPGIVCIEAWPGPGSVTLDRLRTLGFEEARLWKSALEKDWQTTAPAKLGMYELVKDLLHHQVIQRLPAPCVLQMQAMICPKVAPQHPPGGNDDHPDGLGLAHQAVKKIPFEEKMTASKERSRNLKKRYDAARARRKQLPWEF